MVSRLRHVAVLQFALVLMTLYAMIGFIGGIIWALIVGPIMIAGMKAAGAAAGSNSMPGAAMMTSIGLFAIILFPILYGIIGFIGGLIYAALYNLAASWTGGIQWTIENVSEGTEVGGGI